MIATAFTNRCFFMHILAYLNLIYNQNHSGDFLVFFDLITK
jgi:hypothetical protein